MNRYHVDFRLYPELTPRGVDILAGLWASGRRTRREETLGYCDVDEGRPQVRKDR